MNLPLDILQRTPQEAARRIALSFLDEAHAASLRLDDPEDSEALHDFRVAIRRLRSTLRAWRKVLKGSITKKDRKALAALQSATGGGRDAEVALEWLATQQNELSLTHRFGHQWLSDRLRSQLDGAMAHVCEDVRAAFDQIEEDLRSRLNVMKVVVHLEQRRPEDTFAEALADAALDHVRDVVRHLGRVASIEDEDEAHETRIRCKRLRYLLEPVSAHLPEARLAVKECKKIQDVLGELNDCNVLKDELAEALEVSAVEQARRLHALASQGDQTLLRREMRRSERPGLIELVRRLQKRSQRLFRKLKSRYLEDGGEILIQRVQEVVESLHTVSHQGMELEHKFLLRAMPELPQEAEVLEIEQGYLPAEKFEERVRRIGNGEDARYIRTIKVGQGFRRFEVEESISQEAFDRLWQLTDGRRLRKRRHKVRDGHLVWEIDEFLDRDLWLAEVEVESEEQVVDLPQWLAPYVDHEVTEEARYRNRKLAR